MFSIWLLLIRVTATLGTFNIEKKKKLFAQKSKLNMCVSVCCLFTFSVLNIFFFFRFYS